MTEEQRQALEEVQAVAKSAQGAVEVVTLREKDATLEIDITFDCAGVRTTNDGIALRKRERFTLLVTPSFPLEPPSVTVPHRRWSGHPHVQWARSLCLYQAPSTEWIPSDGMFGLLDRLWLFVQRAAENRLDDWGAPQHPPVAYRGRATVPSVIIKADTPALDHGVWVGLAELEAPTDRRIDVVGWAKAGTTEIRPCAAAFLLSVRLPFEFPATVRELTAALESARVTREWWLLALEAAAHRTCEGQPLIVLIGTPARGPRGGTAVQHLAAWCVPPDVATCLRNAVLKFDDDDRLKEIGDRFESIAVQWADDAAVAWCPVFEDRAETTRRRDEESPLALFRRAHLAVWGCGALGSAAAESLVRAGVAKIQLYDRAIVGPGQLVRQRFDDLDIGHTKAGALAKRLQRIAPGLDVTHDVGDLLAGTAKSWRTADVLLDATASLAVATLLERDRGAPAPALVSLMVGHDCRRGLVSVVPAGSAYGPLSAVRAAKLGACNDPSLRAYADEFWPELPRTKIFQPEPGCSDTTFRGSSAEVDMLAATMVCEATNLLRSGSGGATFVSNPTVADGPSIARINLDTPRELVDEWLGYRVFIDEDALDAINDAIRSGAATRGPHVETGGVLFGWRDDAAHVLWVTLATGPPPDSDATEAGFECGVEGVAELAEQLNAATRGAVVPVGMWHTHPDTPALPSAKDDRGMGKLLASTDRPRRQLLYIVGQRGREHRAYLYRRGSP